MQSGAFVQLLVVLAGMASRIRMLSVDLDEALRMTSSSLKQFLSLDAVRPPVYLVTDADTCQGTTVEPCIACGPR